MNLRWGLSGPAVYQNWMDFLTENKFEIISFEEAFYLFTDGV